MTTKLYSYRDKLVGFGPIMVESNEQTAIRGFSYAINNATGVMGFAPSDYDLYCLGDFDTNTGLITPLSVAQMVCNGLSVFNEGEEK